MADISDLRRLALTVLILTPLLFVWIFLLWLHDASHFEWGLPERALSGVSFVAWMWITGGLFVVILLALAVPVFNVPVAPPGTVISKQGSIRQVQCQHCKAVFTIPDRGVRPMTHQCPSCKWLGVYDGRAGAVGEPPEVEAPKRAAKIDLTCGNCDHGFTVTDTGIRPLKVTCPECNAVGSIN